MTTTFPQGPIAVSWGWPVLGGPVHVLGYGNWWVSCPAWLNRFPAAVGGASLNLSQDILGHRQRPGGAKPFTCAGSSWPR